MLPIQNHKYPKNACVDAQISPQPFEMLLKHCRLCCKNFAPTTQFKLSEPVQAPAPQMSQTQIIWASLSPSTQITTVTVQKSWSKEGCSLSIAQWQISQSITHKHCPCFKEWTTEFSAQFQFWKGITVPANTYLGWVAGAKSLQQRRQCFSSTSNGWGEICASAHAFLAFLGYLWFWMGNI